MAVEATAGCRVVHRVRSFLTPGAALRDVPRPRLPALPHSAMSDRFASPAVRAPDFPDTLDWLHTAGRRLTLGDFRGKLLLLDFWTYG